MRRQCPLCERRPGSRDALLGHVAHAHGLGAVVEALTRLATPDATREEFTIRDGAVMLYLVHPGGVEEFRVVW